MGGIQGRVMERSWREGKGGGSDVKLLQFKTFLKKKNASLMAKLTFVLFAFNIMEVNMTCVVLHSISCVLTAWLLGVPYNKRMFLLLNTD